MRKFNYTKLISSDTLKLLRLDVHTIFAVPRWNVLFAKSFMVADFVTTKLRIMNYPNTRQEIFNAAIAVLFNHFLKSASVVALVTAYSGL